MNKYNDKGERHGYWEEYNPYGQLNWRGTYLNGLQHGLFVSYWRNGQLCYKAIWFMGKQIGFWETFDDKGILFGKLFFL